MAQNHQRPFWGFTDMIRHRLTLLALGAVLTASLLPSPAGAQNNYTALYNRYRFHDLGPSARSAGMGGVYSALRGGEMGLTGNPAALGFQEKPYVMLEFDSDEVAGVVRDVKAKSDLWSGGAGLAYPFEWGGVGISYNYRSNDFKADPFTDPSMEFIQDRDLERHALSVGAGYRFTDQLAVGYRYSFLTWDANIDFVQIRPAILAFPRLEENFDGHRNQVGVQYRFNDLLTFGLDGYYGFGDRNSGPLGDADADSWAIRGGVAYKVSETLPLLVAMDLNFENRKLDGSDNNTNEDTFGLHLGAEYKVTDYVALRAGYQYLNIDYKDKDRIQSFKENPSIGGYTAGLGFEWRNFSLDYGFIYTDAGRGEFTNIVGFGFHF